MSFSDMEVNVDIAQDTTLLCEVLRVMYASTFYLHQVNEIWCNCAQYENQVTTPQTRSISICQSNLINTGTINCLPVAA